MSDELMKCCNYIYSATPGACPLLLVNRATFIGADGARPGQVPCTNPPPAQEEPRTEAKCAAE